MITLYIARDKRVITYPGNLRTERIFIGFCLRTHKAEEITCILPGYKPLDKINVHKKILFRVFLFHCLNMLVSNPVTPKGTYFSFLPFKSQLQLCYFLSQLIYYEVSKTELHHGLDGSKVCRKLQIF